MQIKYSTQIPNEVFDDYLPSLKLNELKVLLIILRQTVGYHKDKDWISSSQMEKKTGLSRRSISHAIDELVNNNLIVATSDGGEILSTSEKRKGRQRIFFGSPLTPSEKRDFTYRKKEHLPTQFLPTTKDNHTKVCNTQKSNKPKKVEFFLRDGVRTARYVY
jgi:phage replication O-like protein O